MRKKTAKVWLHKIYVLVCLLYVSHLVYLFPAVCSQVEYNKPDVEIQNHLPNITVKLHERVEINCTIRSIVKEGEVQWRHNDRTMNSSRNIEIIQSSYDQEICSFTSMMIINNFTAAENEGLYTCNASQPNSNYSSDSVYVVIETDPVAGN